MCCRHHAVWCGLDTSSPQHVGHKCTKNIGHLVDFSVLFHKPSFCVKFFPWSGNFPHMESSFPPEMGSSTVLVTVYWGYLAANILSRCFLDMLMVSAMSGINSRPEGDSGFCLCFLRFSPSFIPFVIQASHISERSQHSRVLPNISSRELDRSGSGPSVRVTINYFILVLSRKR